MISTVTQNALEFCPASLNVSGITVFGLKIRIFTFLNSSSRRLASKLARPRSIFECFRIRSRLIMPFCKQAYKSHSQSSFYLENFQGCIVVYLSRFIATEVALILSNHCCISATAYLEYHMLFALSTHFSKIFFTFFKLIFFRWNLSISSPFSICQSLYIVGIFSTKHNFTCKAFATKK